MEKHIAHMYELQKFMQSLALASRRSNPSINALPSRNNANHVAVLKESGPPPSFKKVDEELYMVVAAEKLGVSLPPLAHS